MTTLPPLDSTATDEETLQFLLRTIVYFQPKVVAEAGTWKGHFSAAIANCCPEIQVYTADIFDHKIPEFPNLHFWLGDFENMLGEVPGEIDFAYMDSGPPFFEGDEPETDIRWRHYQAVKSRMSKGGLIINHDMNDLTWDHAVEILAESDLYLPGGRGITIKQMR